MEKNESSFQIRLSLLSLKEWQILKDLFFHEPDCAKFMARRMKYDLKEVFEGLKLLENLGIIERVSATFVKKGKKYKHRNHTYYELKREWRKFLKKYLVERDEI
ncbi:MAG: DUF2250 domain-containing protein [Caldimicrobium sp.]|jgi:predicted transcriptional regulator